MTKKTLVSFLLDETGSMQVCKSSTISGFNEYVGGLRKEKKIWFTLTKFNSQQTTVICDAIRIKDVPELCAETYTPNYTTPLYDAIANTIKRADESVGRMKKKPAIMIVIMTDGLENASREYTQQNVFDLIKDKEEEGWQFVYLGANQDAWAVGQSIGISKWNAATYTQEEEEETFRVLSIATTNYVSKGSCTSDAFWKGHLNEDGTLKTE